ncbi:SIS domain-containing protein [Acidovorax sp.]|uniref:SIS domain-containing protein n=1 Tax=Acidovorax sp. TaxID=1872122 RepID=UPI00263117E7|nr:SIS domain-containing protein [Acidovorax sp.]
MHEELRQAPEVIARQLQADTDTLQALTQHLRTQCRGPLLTLARGSSDHAAHYMAYLIMSRLGRVVASMPPSVMTLHGSQVHTEGLASFAFSQSGQSPDLVLPTRDLTERGATTVALVNAPESPLSTAAHWHLGLHAGPERSVAATKSYIAQLVAGARIAAHWQGDAPLIQALQALPDDLLRAQAQNWDAALAPLKNARGLYVIGRGLGLPIAMEAALKFKETCTLHAEAFSGAELRHGPMALVDAAHPVLIFAPRGPAQNGLLALASDLRAMGVPLLLAAPQGAADRIELPLSQAQHPDLDPIVAVQSFYVMVEALSRARGFDPDKPRHLKKVTLTH